MEFNDLKQKLTALDKTGDIQEIHRLFQMADSSLAKYRPFVNHYFQFTRKYGFREELLELVKRLDLNWDDMRAQMQIAGAYKQLGRYNEASARLAGLVPVPKFRHLAYGHLAQISMFQGRFDKAILFFKRALTSGRPSMIHLEYLVQCYMMESQWSQAQQLLKQIRQLFAQNKAAKFTESLFEPFYHEFTSDNDVVNWVNEHRRDLNLSMLAEKLILKPKSSLLSFHWFALFSTTKEGRSPVFSVDNALNKLSADKQRIPKKIMQYWDQSVPPLEVQQLMQSWAEQNPDWQYSRFDDQSAQSFLVENELHQVLNAYRLADSAAMKCDIFRLAYLWINGGVYSDADSRACDSMKSHVDVSKALIVVQEIHGGLGNYWIAVASKHLVIYEALQLAVDRVISGRRDTWFASGPGVLNLSLAPYMAKDFLSDWRLNSSVQILNNRSLHSFCWSHVGAGYKTLFSWRK